jgi:arsenate reductase
MATNGAAGAIFYGYKACGTCRKASTWLQDHGLEMPMVDITTTPPTPDLLRRALAQEGGRSRLLNTSGQSYRALGAAVVKAMDDGALLQALAADGRLIKRPFLVTPAGPILTGFRQDEWEQALLNP